MTREDIIRMASDAGFSPAEIDVGFIQSRIARFARLVSEHVAAAEREACAKVCENLPAALEEFDALGRAADAIRARGEA